VGLIGAGRIGRLHAANITSRIPQANLLMVADINESAARQVAEQFDVPHAVPDYHALLEIRDIHAVVICAVSGTHTEMMEEAAKAGKHIFVEKPIGVRLEEIDRALEAVARAGVKLQVGFNRRFDPNFARVRRAVAQGEIGEPHLLHIISRDPKPLEYYKYSAGLFLDTAIHDFDMARFLIGSEVTEMYSAALTRLPPDLSPARELDTAITLLKFPNGLLGTIDNSLQSMYGYDQRVEVFGSKGAISTENEYPNSALISDASGIHRDLPLNFFIERYAEAYVIEMQAFVNAVLNEKPTPVNGYDGRMAVVMALAAQKSHKENRPVRLSEVEGGTE
jgi:myo-inositol 2-dehydrogenase/D-chiro-inositol 1-dehydrogenase